MEYLLARENFKRALARWCNSGRKLQELLGASDDAELELALLDARASRKHGEQIMEYARLGFELDSASQRWDAVQQAQAKRTAATFDRDLLLLDC